MCCHVCPALAFTFSRVFALWLFPVCVLSRWRVRLCLGVWVCWCVWAVGYPCVMLAAAFWSLWWALEAHVSQAVYAACEVVLFSPGHGLRVHIPSATARHLPASLTARVVLGSHPHGCSAGGSHAHTHMQHASECVSAGPRAPGARLCVLGTHACSPACLPAFHLPCHHHHHRHHSFCHHLTVQSNCVS